jgi:hypothetical protein
MDVAELTNRYFQLEELEDADRHCTSVLLQTDGAAIIGVTDGPRIAGVIATWCFIEPCHFEMTLTRTYKAGHKHTDMGEFTFDIERILTGKLVMVGAKLAVTGTILLDDNRSEVGFFNMIDTTDEPTRIEEQAEQEATTV